MPTFSYQATDAEGAPQRGEVDASSPAHAAAALRAEGLTPTQITPLPPVTGGAPLGNSPINAGRGAENSWGARGESVHVAPFLLAVPLPHIASMFRQLSTLLRAGVPMLQGITALGEQTPHARLKEILREAAALVSSGKPFSEVLSRHPNVFMPLTIALIRAGEQGGMLETMCARIADYLEREVEIRRKLQRETLYPKIVLFVAGLVLLILAFVNAGMGASAVQAVLARVMLALFVGAGAFGVWWLGRYLHQYPALATRWDEIKLAIPGVGGVARRYATARFCRALGTLYGGGILLQRAVEVSARACGSQHIQETMLRNIPMLMNGGGIAAMLEASGSLSVVAVQMARTGEQTGSLDDMMQKVADYLEAEADAKAHQIAVVTGVVLLILAALIVLYIAISFYVGQVNGAISAGEHIQRKIEASHAAGT